MDHWIFVAFRLLFCLAAFQGLSMMFFEVIARIFGADPHKTSYDHTTPLSSTRRRSNSRSRGSQEVDEEATKNNSALNARVEENNVNFILLPLFGNVHYLMIPSVILGGILVCIWLMFQSEEWAWVLQDVMGVAFLVNVMRLVHLPNLKIATLLLTCAMSYDIFWVYIQPHLFGKESVMVNVARGGDQHESLPMLFMFPRIGDSQGEYSMLGYGDVILPGLLIVHNALFENRFYSSSSSSSPTGGKVVTKMRYKYFVCSIFAYSVGMILTFIALYLKVGGQGGQPALTYLVPTTVLTTVCVAWMNGELKEMWNGGKSGSSADDTHTNSRDTHGESQALL
jgi:signal peptide peptidase-like protein 2B